MGYDQTLKANIHVTQHTDDQAHGTILAALGLADHTSPVDVQVTVAEWRNAWRVDAYLDNGSGTLPTGWTHDLLAELRDLAQQALAAYDDGRPQAVNDLLPSHNDPDDIRRDELVDTISQLTAILGDDRYCGVDYFLYDAG